MSERVGGYQLTEGLPPRDGVVGRALEQRSGREVEFLALGFVTPERQAQVYRQLEIAGNLREPWLPVVDVLVAPDGRLLVFREAPAGTSLRCSLAEGLGFPDLGRVLEAFADLHRRGGVLGGLPAPGLLVASGELRLSGLGQVLANPGFDEAAARDKDLAVLAELCENSAANGDEDLEVRALGAAAALRDRSLPAAGRALAAVAALAVQPATGPANRRTALLGADERRKLVADAQAQARAGLPAVQPEAAGGQAAPTTVLSNSDWGRGGWDSEDPLGPGFVSQLPPTQLAPGGLDLPARPGLDATELMPGGLGVVRSTPSATGRPPIERTAVEGRLDLPERESSGYQVPPRGLPPVPSPVAAAPVAPGLPNLPNLPDLQAPQVSPRPLPLPLVLGAGLVVLLLLVGGGLGVWWWLRSNVATQAVVDPAPPIETLAPPEVAGTVATLVIRAQPWAVYEVEHDGEVVARGEAPSMVELAPGDYRVRLSHPALGEPQGCDVTLVADEASTCEVTMVSVSVDDYLREVGWR